MADGTPPNEHDDAFAEATLQRSPENTPTISGEQPAQAALEFVPGFVLLSRYRIVSKLGKGGMGEVYRADDLKLGQPVALKFLTPGKALSDRQQQLIDEVRIGRDVSHPNVCRQYDIGEVGGHLLSPWSTSTGRISHRCSGASDACPATRRSPWRGTSARASARHTTVASFTAI